MSPAPSRVKAVFLAALDADAVARAAVLDELCAGDGELRRRVEAMLRANDRADPLLDKPAADHLDTRPRAGAPAGPAEERGAEIAGRYRLREVIGEGGMGSVWLAEQTEPVRRTVALKLVKAGMDSRSVLARFEAERQALAMMDHPNIAKVLDGGTTSAGRPFFVMEYVPGLPLTEYCDAEHVEVASRLALFVQVCQAVQHAHQKGVIHRDLKPSNILVRKTDGGPVPKVIDFGLAKAVRQPLTEATLQTGPGMLIGTLQYMAPEQADLDNPDVDTRADVYALGVILYELLTGTTPLDKQRLRKASWLDLLRLIQEEEPPRPSTRLSGSGSLPSVAAQRSLEPARLTRLVRGDLDWIVMKALEKDRGRRYDSAGAFAADVRRYLAGDPVAAHPPSTGYRLRKLVQRHRGRVAAAGLMLLALLAGIVGTTVGLIRAENRRQEAESARANEVGQRQEAETARADEAEQRARAEQALDRTQKALDSLLAVMVGDSLRIRRHALTAEQRRFLDEALTHYRELAAEDGANRGSRARAAWASNRVETILSRLGRGAEAEAEASLRRSIDLWAGLAADFPEVTEYRRHQAGGHNNLGSRLRDQKQRGEAERQFRLALAIQKRLADDFPSDPTYRRDMANTYYNLGFVTDPPRAAEECVRQAVTIRDQLVAESPNDRHFRDALATARERLGRYLLGRKDWDGTEEQFRWAVDLRARLAAEPPATAEDRRSLAGALNDLGMALNRRGDRPAAEKVYRRIADLRKQLADESPDLPDYKLDHGGICCDLAALLTDDGRPGEGLPWFDRAVGILAPVYDRDSQSATAREYLWNTYFGRANALSRLGRYGEAAADWDAALTLDPDAQRSQVRLLRARALARAGRAAEVLADAAELAKSPGWSASSWYALAGVYARASGQVGDRKQEYADRAVELLREAVRAGFDNAAGAARDEDLAPLRDRADFKKLLAEMGQKKP